MQTSSCRKGLLIAVAALLLFPCSTFAAPWPCKRTGNELPRSAPNADKPGSYEIALRTPSRIINDLDKRLLIQVFVTGYGEIGGAKLMYVSPTEFINNVRVTDALKIDEKTGGLPCKNGHMEFVWGGRERTSKAETFVVVLKGFHMKKGPWTAAASTPFVDFEPNSEFGPAPILTELQSKGKAFIELGVKPKDGLLPGNHEMQFVLTYFNGARWKSSRESIVFYYPTLYERNRLALSLIGIIVAVLSFMGWRWQSVQERAAIAGRWLVGQGRYFARLLEGITRRP